MTHRAGARLTRSQPRDNLRLDRLVLGVGDQPLLEHLPGALESLGGVSLSGARGRALRGARSTPDGDPSRLGTDLLDLANPSLLPPGLLLGLADPVDGRRLGLAKTRDREQPGPLRGDRQVAALDRAHEKVRTEHTDGQPRVPLVLPADVLRHEPADETPMQEDQTAGRGADDQAATAQREQAALHGVGLETLTLHEQPPQVRERRAQPPALLVTLPQAAPIGRTCLHSFSSFRKSTRSVTTTAATERTRDGRARSPCCRQSRPPRPGSSSSPPA